MTHLSTVVLAFCAAMRLSAQSYVGTWALTLVDRVAPDGNRPKFASGSKLTGTPDENQLKVADDQLTILQPTTSAGGTGVITWRRVSEPSLVGTWTLTAADEIRPDGKRVQAYGDHPEGQLILDEAGHYSVWVSRAMRTKFKSGNKSSGTPDEYKAATLEISSHYGRYAVDTATHTLTFDIVHASFPNLEGVEEKRPYQLEGDDLEYRIPPRADGTISISAWRRVR